MKLFNKHPIQTQLFVIFCPGGIDFVGGYSFYTFLKHSLPHLSSPSTSALASFRLGKLQISDSTGEQVHTRMFAEIGEKGEGKDRVSTPNYWKDILNYY